MSQVKNGQCPTLSSANSIPVPEKQPLKGYTIVEIVPLLREQVTTRFKNGEPVGSQLPQDHGQPSFKAFRKRQGHIPLQQSVRSKSPDCIPDSQILHSTNPTSRERARTPEVFEDLPIRTPDKEKSVSPIQTVRKKAKAIAEEDNEDVIMVEATVIPREVQAKKAQEMSNDSNALDSATASTRTTRRTRSHKEALPEPVELPAKRRRK